MEKEGRRYKIIRMATIPESIDTFCKDLLRELSAEYEVIALSSLQPALERVKKREGVRVIPVEINRRISPIKDLISLWRLIKTFKKERPDIVHSMTPKAGLLGMCAAKIAGVKFRVHSFTGLVFPTATGFKRLILKITDKLTCFCATHLLPEGEGVKRDLQNNRITTKELKVLGHGNIRGIDLEHYSRSAEVEKMALSIREPELFTFLFVGRIVKDKGVNELVEAFLRLNEEFLKTRLILVGGKDSGIDPINHLIQKEIDNNPKILEVGLQLDVRPWYAAVDCFVLPSYREGFPNSVIEAGAMGLPCIVTDINGANEIILEGENGIIVPPKSVDALYLAMKEMLINIEKRQKMANSARELVAERYERSYVWACLKEFYASLLKPQSPKQ